MNRLEKLNFSFLQLFFLTSIFFSAVLIVLPGVGVKELKANDLKRNLDILSNTSAVQAVSHKLGIYQMVFFHVGELDLGNGLFIDIDTPGLIMPQREGEVIEKITVADPSRKLLKLRFRLSLPINPTSEAATSV